MSDVFVSYSRLDKAFVELLLRGLAKENRDVWIDWEDIPRAADWLNEIYAGIDETDTFVFVVSVRSECRCNWSGSCQYIDWCRSRGDSAGTMLLCKQKS